MRADNYERWLRLVSTRPNVLVVFLKTLFAEMDDKCDCLEKGIMFIPGNVNKCGKCTDLICKLDTHLFLGNVSTTLIGWISMIPEGMNRYIVTYFNQY